MSPVEGALNQKQVIANARLKEQQILGCLIVEIFLAEKFRAIWEVRRSKYSKCNCTIVNSTNRSLHLSTFPAYCTVLWRPVETSSDAQTHQSESTAAEGRSRPKPKATKTVEESDHDPNARSGVKAHKVRPLSKVPSQANPPYLVDPSTSEDDTADPTGKLRRSKRTQQASVMSGACNHKKADAVVKQPVRKGRNLRRLPPHGAADQSEIHLKLSECTGTIRRVTRTKRGVAESSGVDKGTDTDEPAIRESRRTGRGEESFRRADLNRSLLPLGEEDRIELPIGPETSRKGDLTGYGQERSRTSCSRLLRPSEDWLISSHRQTKTSAYVGALSSDDTASESDRRTSPRKPSSKQHKQRHPKHSSLDRRSDKRGNRSHTTDCRSPDQTIRRPTKSTRSGKSKSKQVSPSPVRSHGKTHCCDHDSPKPRVHQRHESYGRRHRHEKDDRHSRRSHRSRDSSSDSDSSSERDSPARRHKPVKVQSHHRHRDDRDHWREPERYASETSGSEYSSDLQSSPDQRRPYRDRHYEEYDVAKRDLRNIRILESRKIKYNGLDGPEEFIG
ncbi:uncharacterized protein LOC131669209 [Phymastichus coffea]|uniref:uncharacterized protein LOC131669209 n=1 Tax=Phymastichus coffea TaxID=108790 RepID=UPI00273B6ED4|nr:uncharacterized protein LOC131669209 [Phymastichus coffea]